MQVLVKNVKDLVNTLVVHKQHQKKWAMAEVKHTSSFIILTFKFFCWPETFFGQKTKVRYGPKILSFCPQFYWGARSEGFERVFQFSRTCYSLQFGTSCKHVRIFIWFGLERQVGKRTWAALQRVRICWFDLLSNEPRTHRTWTAFGTVSQPIRSSTPKFWPLDVTYLPSRPDNILYIQRIQIPFMPSKKRFEKNMVSVKLFSSSFLSSFVIDKDRPVWSVYHNSHSMIHASRSHLRNFWSDQKSTEAISCWDFCICPRNAILVTPPPPKKKKKLFAFLFLLPKIIDIVRYILLLRCAIQYSFLELELNCINVKNVPI